MLATVVALFALQAGVTPPSPAVSVPPSEPAPHTRAGRHGIEIDGNLLGTSEIGTQASLGGARVEAHGSGRGMNISYSRWLDERAALQLSVGMLSADARVSTSGGRGNIESAVVVPLLVGFKYQPFKFDPSDGVRPFVFAAVGAYVANSAAVKASVATSIGAHSESVLGGRVGGGIDLLAGRRLTFSTSVGLREVGKFAQPVGGKTKFSGAEFNLGMGILLGRGR